ncbi:MAG: hypothetical protein ACT4ON_08580 [Bacteroidota bacterium]
MKKTVLVIALAFGVSGAFAQDLTSKKGEPILPEAEDWAISMNVDPIFEYVGNAFSGSTTKNTAPTAGFLNSNNTIIGKKFIDEKNAYRVLVRIGLTSETYKNMVDQDNPAVVVFPANAPMVEDKYKNSNTTIAIGAGKEMRRGKTRLQGFYGADVMIWLSSNKQKYEYGNAMAVTVPAAAGSSTNPTTTNWNADGTVNTGTPTINPNNRTTESKSGMTFGVGIRGFIGVEYFIFPKIAIGAEYGWGIGFQTSGKGKTSNEKNNGIALGDEEIETSGSSKLGADTDINQSTIFGFKGSNTGNSSIPQGSASLRVTFHF